MMGKEHLAFGIASGIAGSVMLFTDGQLGLLAAVGFAGLSAIGSLLPDVDQEGTMAYKKIFVLRWIPLVMEHRTYTHDLFWIGLVALAMHLLHVPLVWYGLLFGVLTHIFLDGFTKDGLPIFYPFNKNFHLHWFPRFMRPKAKGKMAVVITVVCCMIALQFGARVSIRNLGFTDSDLKEIESIVLDGVQEVKDAFGEVTYR